jgi:hypothetical protein
MLTFCDPELTRALEALVHDAKASLPGGLVSVVLHGSAALGDLAPGYGDLDFLVVTKGELSKEECGRLVEERRRFRVGEYGLYGQMLEGVFLPRRLLDPNAQGLVAYWGTSGERVKTSNQLGWFSLHLMRLHGLVVWGEDIRGEVPEATPEALLSETWALREDIREHGLGGTLHSVDWLLMAARALRWLREGELSSKSGAADWALARARGEWRGTLPRAKQIRLSPALAESEETQTWLSCLTPTIQAAGDELEAELRSWPTRSIPPPLPSSSPPTASPPHAG